MRHALRVFGVGEVGTHAQTDSLLINWQIAVLVAGAEHDVFAGMQILLGVGDDIAPSGEGQCANQHAVVRPPERHAKGGRQSQFFSQCHERRQTRIVWKQSQLASQIRLVACE